MDNFLEEFKKLKEKVEALEKRTLSSLKLDSLTAGIIKPSSDSTSAIKITKADGTTVVFNIDSNNGFIGIGTDTPGQILELRRDNASIGIRFHDPNDRWYTIGIDYNDGRKFKINEDGGFSSNNRLTISGSNIGIGTTSPSTRLHLHNGRFRVSESDGSGLAGIIELSNGTKINYIFTGSDGHLYTRTDDTSKHVLLQAGSSSGNVGINTTTPSEKLEVNGNAKVGEIKVSNGTFRSLTRSNFILVLQGDRNMVLYDNGTAIWNSGTAQSDIRLKKNIKEMENVLENIKKIRVVRFNYKNYQSKKQQIGIIAQELEKYYPEFIFTDKKGYKLIFYDKLTTILIKAIQELSLKVENLEKKIWKD